MLFLQYFCRNENFIWWVSKKVLPLHKKRNGQA